MLRRGGVGSIASKAEEGGWQDSWGFWYTRHMSSRMVKNMHPGYTKVPKNLNYFLLFFSSFFFFMSDLKISRKISHHLPQLRSVGESRLALGARPCQFRALQKRGKIHLDNGVYSSKAQKKLSMKNEGRGADSDGNRNLALLQKANKKKITTKLREKKY